MCADQWSSQVCEMSTVRVPLSQVSQHPWMQETNCCIIQYFCSCFAQEQPVFIWKFFTLDLQWCLCGAKSSWELLAKLYSTPYGNSQVVSWATPLSLSKPLLVSAVLCTRTHPQMMLLIDSMCHTPLPINFCMIPCVIPSCFPFPPFGYETVYISFPFDFIQFTHCWSSS